MVRCCPCLGPDRVNALGSMMFCCRCCSDATPNGIVDEVSNLCHFFFMVSPWAVRCFVATVCESCTPVLMTSSGDGASLRGGEKACFSPQSPSPPFSIPLPLYVCYLQCIVSRHCLCVVVRLVLYQSVPLTHVWYRLVSPISCTQCSVSLCVYLCSH